VHRHVFARCDETIRFKRKSMLRQTVEVIPPKCKKCRRQEKSLVPIGSSRSICGSGKISHFCRYTIYHRSFVFSRGIIKAVFITGRFISDFKYCVRMFTINNASKLHRDRLKNRVTDCRKLFKNLRCAVVYRLLQLAICSSQCPWQKAICNCNM